MADELEKAALFCYSVALRLSKTNKLTDFFDSRTEEDSSSFLPNESKSSSIISSPKCFRIIPSIPDLTPTANTLGGGFSCLKFSIISTLKYPFAFTITSTSSREAVYCGILKQSTFSSEMIPYSAK